MTAADLIFVTRLDGPLAWAAAFCAASVLGALACAVWRLLRGPTRADRVVALDFISALLVALFTLMALAFRHAAFLDAALALALVAFLATVAFARYLERATLRDDR